MFIEAKRVFSNEDFTNNLSLYAYDSLLEEYPDIEWTEQNLLQDEKWLITRKAILKLQ